MSILPKRGRGRPSSASEAAYQAKVQEFCDLVGELRCGMSFTPESRSWCYLLEPYGLPKGDFDQAQKLINDCRKDGRLPVDIVAADGRRSTLGDWNIQDDDSPDGYADRLIQTYISNAHLVYIPISPHGYQECYVEVIAEKGDIAKLFAQVLDDFYVPVTPIRGWADINSRADLIGRLGQHDNQHCVLLVCTDHDPGGLNIAGNFEKNLDDLRNATYWDDDVEIIRFGLNEDFIDQHGLTWIDNLETSSGKNLADPRNDEHHKSYVQSYIHEFGERKCELNALMARPELGHQLVLDAVEPYISQAGIDKYHRDLNKAQQEAKITIPEAMEKWLAEARA
jgi:hypothetical protein